MSNAAAAAAPADAAPAPKGKKKLIIIAAAAVLVLAGGGGAAFMMMKKKADPEAGGDGHAPKAQVEKAKPKAAKHDPKSPPAFVPLDPFTVNLADRETERYAQIAMTLEVDEAKTGDQIKVFLPAVRNNILMVLAHKTSAQMLEREGKLKLADEIRREVSRALGIEVEDPEDEDEAADAAAKKPKKKKKKAAEQALPIVAVHFSNFIIQ